MKNLILICSFILFSCGNSDKIEISKEEYNQLKGGEQAKYPKSFYLDTSELGTFSSSSGVILGSDGHDYLVLYKNSNAMNVEHYIDCELCIKRKKG